MKMVTRTYTARVCLEFTKDGKPTGDYEILKKLWATHSGFNQGAGGEGGLREAIVSLTKMLNGKWRDPHLSAHPELLKELQAYLRTAFEMDAAYGVDLLSKLLGPFSKKGGPENKIANLIERSSKELSGQEEIHRQRKLATYQTAQEFLGRFDGSEGGWYPLAHLKQRYAAWGSSFLTQLLSQAIQHIKSHVELRSVAREAAEERKRLRAEWAKAHPDHMAYLALRHEFRSFEEASGVQLGRWRMNEERYLNWLTETPRLLRWRGNTAELTLPTSEQLAQITIGKKEESSRLICALFFDLNPELKELDRIHSEFDRQFAVRRKGKLRDDDYVDLPSFTLPSSDRHPRNLVLGGPQSTNGWDSLVLKESGSKLGSIRLRVIPQSPQASSSKRVTGEFVTVRFFGDERFAHFHTPDQAVKGLSCLYRDPITKRDRKAVFSGVRLRFRQVKRDEQDNFKTAVVYLDFTVGIEALPNSERAQVCQWLKKSGELSSLALAPNTVIASVMFNPHGLAWVTVFRVESSGELTQLRTRNLRPFQGLSDRDLKSLDQELDQKRSESKRMAKGQRFGVELHRHLVASVEQRVNTGAAEIVKFALGFGSNDPAAEVLLLGAPELLKVGTAQRGSANRQRARYSVMSLAEKLQFKAEDCGLKVLSSLRSGFDLVCKQCSNLGMRYSTQGKNGEREIRFISGGELFACSSCGTHSVNAFYNASVTLLRAARDPKYLAPIKKWRALSDLERAKQRDGVQAELLPTLRLAHKIPIKQRA